MQLSIANPNFTYIIIPSLTDKVNDIHLNLSTKNDAIKTFSRF